MATNTDNRSKWFTVHAGGLQSLAERRSPGWWAFELIQNALDEQDVSTITLTMQEIVGRDDAIRVICTDDAPAGWENLEEASVMFAPSKKATDPELRGRFNIGEKLFLSICESAHIQTTSGMVAFQKSGRKVMYRDKTCPVGTVIDAIVLVPPSEIPTIKAAALGVIAPSSIELWVNGSSRFWDHPIATTSGALPTEFDRGDGQMSRTERTTEVEVYELGDGDEPMIYEMGIPICAHEGGEHHINIMQTVPLSIERQSVTPRYLERVYGLVLDAVADQLDAEQAAASWVTQGFKDADSDSVVTAMGARFGKDAVVFTPGAPESNAEAMAAGRTVIPPQALPRDAWEAVRGARKVNPDLAPSSAQSFPTGIEHKAGGQRPIEQEEWTYQMVTVADYAEAMARHCIGVEPRVLFYEVDNAYEAWWKRSDYNENIDQNQRPVLSINLAHLGKAVRKRAQVKIDEVLVHEMGHEIESNHLSHEFHDALCKIAARLRTFDGRLQ